MLLPPAPFGGYIPLDFVGGLAHRRCAIAVSDACRAWIHRRCIWSARRHDRRAADILGSRHPLSPVRTKIAELLRLSTEVHRLDPGGGFAAIVRASVAELRDFAKSGLEGTSDRPNDGLSDKCGLERMAEGEADRAAGNTCCHVRHSDADDHENYGESGIDQHVGNRETSRT